MPGSFDLDLQRMVEHLHVNAQSTADKITEAVRPHAPVGKDTPDHTGGGLRDGLKGTVQEERPGGVTLAVTSDKDYAKYVIKGTNPHIIEVRYARALRFWVEGGNLVFAQWVTHPGTEANPFYRDAEEEIRGIVQDDVRAAVRAAMHP